MISDESNWRLTDQESDIFYTLFAPDTQSQHLASWCGWPMLWLPLAFGVCGRYVQQRLVCQEHYSTPRFAAIFVTGTWYISPAVWCPPTRWSCQLKCSARCLTTFLSNTIDKSVLHWILIGQVITLDSFHSSTYTSCCIAPAGASNME